MCFDTFQLAPVFLDSKIAAKRKSPKWRVSKQAVREAATICPAPCDQSDLDLWLFDLDSGVRVTCDVGYLCANFSLPRPLCSRLRPDVRDRHTDVRVKFKLSHSSPPTSGKLFIANTTVNFRIKSFAMSTIQNFLLTRQQFSMITSSLLQSLQIAGFTILPNVKNGSSQLRTVPFISCLSVIVCREIVLNCS